MLERMKDHYDKDKERLELNTASLDRSHRLLVSMKEGSNHLYETLKEIKLTLVSIKTIYHTFFTMSKQLTLCTNFIPRYQCRNYSSLDSQNFRSKVIRTSTSYSYSPLAPPLPGLPYPLHNEDKPLLDLAKLLVMIQLDLKSLGLSVFSQNMLEIQVNGH